MNPWEMDWGKRATPGSKEASGPMPWEMNWSRKPSDSGSGITEQAEQPKDLGLTGRGLQFAGGVNRTLGAPVDAASWLLYKVGVDTGPAPVGGSQWMQDTFGKAPEATDTTGRVLDYTGSMVGASMLPYGAVAGAARLSPMVNTSSRAPSIVSDMVNSAKTNPGAYAASVLTNATLAGLGGATAREIAPGSATAEIIGQLTPAAAIHGVPATVKKVMRGGENVRQRMEQNLNTFDQAGIKPTLGQVSERTITQAGENMLANVPGGSGVIRKAAAKAADDLKASIEKQALAMSGGRLVNPTQAGLEIQRGIDGPDGIDSRFQSQAEQLYSKVDAFIRPDTKVKVDNTAQTLRALTQPIPGAERLSAELTNPKLSRIEESFSQAATLGLLPYEALRELRSKLGRQLSSSELISEAPRAELKQLYAALSKDMEEAAKAAGPQALNAYNRANNYWRAGRGRIDNTLETIIKRANPEDVYRLAVRGKDGASAILPLRRSLKPEQWDIVAGLTLRRLGQAKAGQQNAEGTSFSIQSFLPNWNNLSPQAQKALFGGTRYAQTTKDLDVIVKAASIVRDSAKVGANPSGTAGMSANIAALSTAGGGLAAGLASGNMAVAIGTPSLIAGLAGMNAGAAKLMTNQTFIRWLASATKLPAKAVPGYLARLPVALRDEQTDVKEAAAEYLDQLQGPNNDGQ